MKSTYSGDIYSIGGIVDGMKLHSTVTFHDNPCHSKDVLDAFTKLWKATANFVMPVRLSAWNNSAPPRWSLLKFDI
jgi:hypothetical protein